MADTFASFNKRVEKFGKAMGADSISHAMGGKAKQLAERAASADLGGDPKFSGWEPTLATRYEIVGAGKIIFHPTRASAGPWTVAQYGRNAGAGPSIGGKGKRGSRRRYNGRTQGKGTSDDALSAINDAMPKIVDEHVGKAIRSIF